MPCIVKTQLNHNQVKVALTTLWVCNPPPTHPVKLCVVVVQLSNNQQHNTVKSYKTKIEIVKTQLNHNQVKVGLTTLWVSYPPPPPPPPPTSETLCCCCST